MTPGGVVPTGGHQHAVIGGARYYGGRYQAVIAVGMGSYYHLQDHTTGQYLIDCPGSVMKEIFWLIDARDSDAPEIAVIEDWEYHGYDAADPPASPRSAVVIEADMKALIGVFYELPPDRKLGVLTALEWIDQFERVIAHAQAHPEHVFRSCFFE